MTDYFADISRLLRSKIARDWETRILIPNRLPETVVSTMVSTLVKRELVNETVAETFTQSMDAFLQLPFFILPVKEINFHKEHIIPRSKGIGSIGEILHFVGSTNEEINLSFKTDQFPGVFGWYLKTIFNKALNYADIIYIIDEMTLVLPCAIEVLDLKKSGEYDGVIAGEMELVALVENNFSQISQTVVNLKKTVTEALKRNDSTLATGFALSYLGGTLVNFIAQMVGVAIVL